MQDHMAQQQTLHLQPVEDGLRAVRDLPACFHPVFSSFRYFNIVQSECFSVAHGSDHNMVVSAPTGSGKTGVLELAMLRCLSRHITPSSSFQAPRGTSKIIYVGPIRALVQERVQDWGERFGRLGCTCVELTGDNDAVADNLAEADIICTTPEKFDQVTRRMQEYGAVNFLSQTSLVLLDEVHLLNEAGRGSSLEAGTVCRIKMVSQIPELTKMPIASVRFVAVSATIPNFQDIAAWLHVPPCAALQFGEELRPVKLTTYVKGYAPAKNDFLFERRLNNFLHDVVLEHHHGRPALVFCNSRKGAADAAAAVAKDATTRNRGPFGSTFVSSALQLQHLQGAAAQTKNKALQGVLVTGVGFHNAAMEPEDRALVEGLFKQGDLQVLCTTSTLAMGVNLPAHLVVIKGTRRYVGEQELAPGDRAGYREYARSECLQMVGRAGRPQFDTEGVAVIMTQQSTVGQYQVLVDGQLVESCLPGSVAEHLNAELVLGTVKDVASAVSWLHTTFLYQRAMRSPGHYGFRASSLEELQEQVTQKYVLSNISTLTTYGMVETSYSSSDPTHAQQQQQQQQQVQVLKPLQPGRIMAQNFLRLGTMVEIAKEQPRPGMSALLGIVCRAEEFRNITLRRSEKKVLNEINHGSGVRFHVTEAAGAEGAKRVKQRIQTAQEKLLILINEGLSDSPSDQLDYGMKQEMDTVLRAGQRITTAMYKYYSHKNQLSAAGNALLLARSFRQRLWDNSQQQVRQLKNVSKPIAEKLAAAGLGSLRDVLEMDPHNCNRLQAAAGKYYPFGLNLIMDLRRLAPPPMTLDLSLQRRVGPNALDCQLVLALAPGAGAEGSGMAGDTSFTLVCGCVNTDTLLLWRHVVPQQLQQQLELPFKVVLPPGTQGPVKLTAFLAHNKMVGFDQSTQLHVQLDGSSAALAAGGAAHQPQLKDAPQQQRVGRAGAPAAAVAPAAEAVSPSTHSSSTSASCHRAADLEGQDTACADSAAAVGGSGAAGASSKRTQGDVAAAGAGGSKRPRRLQAPPPDDPFACQDTAMLLSPVLSAAGGPAAAGGAAANWSTSVRLGGFAMQPPPSAAAAAGHQSSTWGAPAAPAGPTSSIAARYASFLQQKHGLHLQQNSMTAPAAAISPSPTAGSSAQLAAVQPQQQQQQQQQQGKDMSPEAPGQQEPGWQEQERVAAADDAALLYVSPMPSSAPPEAALGSAAAAAMAAGPRKPFEAFGRSSLSSSGQQRSATAAGLQLPVLKRFKPAAGTAQLCTLAPTLEPSPPAVAGSDWDAPAAQGVTSDTHTSSHQSSMRNQQQPRGQSFQVGALSSSSRKLCLGSPAGSAAGGDAGRQQNWELFDDLAADAGQQQQQQQATTGSLHAGGLQQSSHSQSAASGHLAATGLPSGSAALQQPASFWGSSLSSYTMAPTARPPPAAAAGLSASAAASRWSTQHSQSRGMTQRPTGQFSSPAVASTKAGVAGMTGSMGFSGVQGDAMQQLLQQPSSSFSYAAAPPAAATATGFKQAVDAAAAAAGGAVGVRSGAAQLLAKLGHGNSSRLPLGTSAAAVVATSRGISSTSATDPVSRGPPGGLHQFAFQSGGSASGMGATAALTAQQHQQPPAAAPGGLRLSLGVPQLRPGLFGGGGSSTERSAGVLRPGLTGGGSGAGRLTGLLRPLRNAAAAAAASSDAVAAGEAGGDGGAEQGWAGVVGDAAAAVAVSVRDQSHGSKPAATAAADALHRASAPTQQGAADAAGPASAGAGNAAGSGGAGPVDTGYQLDLVSVFDFL